MWVRARAKTHRMSLSFSSRQFHFCRLVFQLIANGHSAGTKKSPSIATSLCWVKKRWHKAPRKVELVGRSVLPMPTWLGGCLRGPTTYYSFLSSIFNLCCGSSQKTQLARIRKINIEKVKLNVHYETPIMHVISDTCNFQALKTKERKGKRATYGSLLGIEKFLLKMKTLHKKMIAAQKQMLYFSTYFFVPVELKLNWTWFHGNFGYRKKIIMKLIPSNLIKDQKGVIYCLTMHFWIAV